MQQEQKLSAEHRIQAEKIQQDLKQDIKELKKQIEPIQAEKDKKDLNSVAPLELTEEGK